MDDKVVLSRNSDALGLVANPLTELDISLEFTQEQDLPSFISSTLIYHILTSNSL